MIAPVPPDAELVRKLAAAVGLPLDDARVAEVKSILGAQLAASYPAEIVTGVEPSTRFEVDWP
jgi:hypothetical protein